MSKKDTGVGNRSFSNENNPHPDDTWHINDDEFSEQETELSAFPRAEFQPRQVILEPGPLTAAYIINKGEVDEERVDQEGQGFVLFQRLGAGQIIAYEWFRELDMTPSRFVAKTNVTVFEIKREHWLEAQSLHRLDKLPSGKELLLLQQSELIKALANHLGAQDKSVVLAYSEQALTDQALKNLETELQAADLLLHANKAKQTNAKQALEEETALRCKAEEQLATTEMELAQTRQKQRELEAELDEAKTEIDRLKAALVQNKQEVSQERVKDQSQYKPQRTESAITQMAASLINQLVQGWLARLPDARVALVLYPLFVRFTESDSESLQELGFRGLTVIHTTNKTDPS